MAHYTDKFGEFVTTEDLSFAALARIEQVRADVADDRISKEMGDRHIRVIIGQDTGKGHFISSDTDLVQYGIIKNGFDRISGLISMTRENISSKMFDPEEDFPLDGASLDHFDAFKITEVLDIITDSANEMFQAASVICAE